MKQKKEKPINKFLSLTPEQRGRVAAEFDREFVSETFRPLSAESKRLWNLAKRKRGRPRVGLGAERISVTIERSLLKSADREAKRMGVSRAQLIALGLEAVVRKPRKRAA